MAEPESSLNEATKRDTDGVSKVYVAAKRRTGVFFGGFTSFPSVRTFHFCYAMTRISEIPQKLSYSSFHFPTHMLLRASFDFYYMRDTVY